MFLLYFFAARKLARRHVIVPFNLFFNVYFRYFFASLNSNTPPCHSIWSVFFLFLFFIFSSPSHFFVVACKKASHVLLGLFDCFSPSSTTDGGEWVLAHEWVVSHVNQSYGWVMSHMNESCHIWTNHMDESCRTWMSRVTCEPIIVSHVNESHGSVMRENSFSSV